MSKETDISQITKYLGGTLDAKAMHQLEKRALDDPFLMDALEGYAANGKDQQMQLEEITRRLKTRVSGEEKRIIPWKYFAIAASVLVMATIGALLLVNKKTDKPQLAQIVVPETKKEVALPAAQQPKVTNDVTALKARSPQSLSARAANPQAKKRSDLAKNKGPVSPVMAAVADDREVESKESKPADASDKDTMPLNEMIVTEYTSGKKKDISQNVVGANLMKVKKADTVAVQLLQGQAKGVADNNVTPPVQAYSPIPVPGAVNKLNQAVLLHKESEPSKSVIKGQVVSAPDGFPMSNATIRVAGSNVHTQTDINGYFKIPADSAKTTLVVGSIGYETRKIATNNGDSVKKISLSASNHSLAEVVVAKPTPAFKKAGSIGAHPRQGWVDLKKYLEKNAVSPDKKMGSVTISLIVDRNGVISNLQVTKGLSDVANQKALYLISNGPAWAGNNNGQPQKIELKIEFNQ